MDIKALFEAQKTATVGTDYRSRGIALSMVDVDSIILNDLRFVGEYKNSKPTGEPDVNELGDPKVTLTLRFILKSGATNDVSTASDYMNVKLVQDLITNKGKAVEVEDLYILPYIKGAKRKDGTDYGQQLFELRFKSIKLKSFDTTK